MIDTAASVKGRAETADALPAWDLADLYPAPDSAEVEGDLREAERKARGFRDRFAGRLADLDDEALGRAVGEYERLTERLARLVSYASLKHAEDANDPESGRFFQTILERVNEISSEVLFFTLALNHLEEGELAEKLAAAEATDGALAHYAPWLRDLRVFRPHQLADDIERLFHEKTVTGRAAWMRLFDETRAALRVPYNGRTLTAEEVTHLLTDPDGEVRRTVAESFAGALAERASLFALVTNTLAKDKEVEDRWRRFPTPQSSRHLANLLEEEIVDALVRAVKDAYPRLSHRYYRLKAGWLGVDRLAYWDRNAPLPEAEDRTYSWEEARSIVLAGYERFSPEMAAIGERFFERRWIDAAVRPGKVPGAFSHPTVPSVHPYILLNYQGRARDVTTLAHELGHGIHQVLAAPCGALMAETPLTLAETASVFGEMLVFRSLLEGETNGARRRALLALKVEDVLNTVVRQIAFYDFESMLHAERRRGELTPDRIGEMWLKTQTESLGPAFRLDDEYGIYWTYVPHFIHAPFYVYAYAFGECLVHSLYSVYRTAEEGFAEKYLKMLRAGGTLRHRELLAPFGLDARDPAFWERGVALLSSFIDELERGA